jgi:transposase
MVSVLQWSTFSPDLNPTEHLWDELDKQIRCRPNPPTTVQDLEQALLLECPGVEFTIKKLF